MIRPNHFGYNQETAASNAFQQNSTINDIANMAREEFDSMVVQMKDKGIRVQVFEDVDEVLPDAVFPNNWFSHIPSSNRLIIYSMMAPNRQLEIREDVIDWLKRELNIEGVIDLSEEHQAGNFLEGTGSIVFDHDDKKAYCCISPRSDVKLFSALCREIEYEPISFEALDLKGNQIYHTNVMMSVCSKVVLACMEAVPNLLERKLLENNILNSGKELIDLTYHQMLNFAANTIEMRNDKGESVLIMSDQSLHALTSQQLEQLRKYFEIVSIKIPTIEKIGGGSVRCMIAGCYCSR